MKKILAAVAAFAAVSGFATNALADSSGTQIISSGTSYDSVHTGTVTATCSVNVTDGALGTVGLANSMTSTTNGSIATVCNNAGSTIAVGLDTGSAPAAATSAIGYTESFKLTSGTGAYPSTPMSAFGVAYNQTDLSNGYSAGASTMAVTAKVAVNSGLNLPAGAYTVKVKATVTP